MMKMIKISTTKTAPFFFILCLFLLPTHAHATCSCSPSYYGSIAYEYTAQSCPPEDATDSTVYYYDSEQVTCNNSVISYYTNNSDGNFTPQQLVNTYKNILIVLRNPSGTHIIAVFPYYNGTINGINVSSLGPGVYTYDAMDQFCNNINTPDTDSDSFPDCLDCAPNDFDMSQDCPLCLNEEVAQCGSEENSLDWHKDSEGTCIGICIEENLGKVCPTTD